MIQLYCICLFFMRTLKYEHSSLFSLKIFGIWNLGTDIIGYSFSTIKQTGKAPYSSVITHGFVLDKDGFKMSKSVGNVIDPNKVIVGGKNAKVCSYRSLCYFLVLRSEISINLVQEEPPYGADVLRLWVSSVDYTGDVLIGSQILRQTSDMYRKLRGTMRFLLGNLHDWKVSPGGQVYIFSAKFRTNFG